MRKKVLSVLSVVTIVALAAYASHMNDEKVELTGIALENAEALASEEPEINPDCPNGCLTDPGSCKCNGPHPFLEAVWP